VTRFDAGKLAAVMAVELARRHVDPESSQHVVASLVQTSLRGVDSHGINLFPHYCRAVEAGRINIRPRISISRTGPSTDRARRLPPLSSGGAVMVSGDPEKKSFLRRSIEGIPIDDTKYAEFSSLSPEFESARAP
jgi:LDH2 family malate/lactate/ureidoglycolate dehydrogenase